MVLRAPGRSHRGAEDRGSHNIHSLDGTNKTTQLHVTPCNSSGLEFFGSRTIFLYTWTLQGVSNGLPHTTYGLPLGTPWRVLVQWLSGFQVGLFQSPFYVHFVDSTHVHMSTVSPRGLDLPKSECPVWRSISRVGVLIGDSSPDHWTMRRRAGRGRRVH